MSDIKDGGSAFPGLDKPTGYTWEGMSLRDYFAAQCYSVLLMAARDGGDYEDFDGAAQDAYRRADALLRAREAK